MAKVKLTKIYTTDKDKQGNPLISKQGKPYTRMSIKAVEYGEKWISGFKNAVSANWKEGDEVEVNIIQNGEYLNFDTPKKDDRVIEMLGQVLIGIGKLNAKFDVLYGKKDLPDDSMKDLDTGEALSTEDIPF